ncbi:MAG: hypothetical protein ACK4FB_13665 [Brevundimonas sp.]|uniref:hypothetical protein n=1 Tax=Brevundimonas sp. TaxID=1871086 RepID=UPI00391CE9C9
MVFEVGATYTRDDVQTLLNVPEAQRGGNWDTGYNRYDSQLFVFCNVGSAGRTGHDYQNEWVGDQLVWFAKTGTHIGQPLMRLMTLGEIPVHVFWRANSRHPFTYQGLAQSIEVKDASPVRFRWSFAQPPASVVRDDPVVSSLATEADALGTTIAGMAAAIQQRIKRSAEPQEGFHPNRTGPEFSELVEGLRRQWHRQNGLCSLCERPIPLAPKNRLLQMSPDRIDSANKAYAADNVHLTHLGCNLAKSSANMADWDDYLSVVRAQP